MAVKMGCNMFPRFGHASTGLGHVSTSEGVEVLFFRLWGVPFS